MYRKVDPSLTEEEKAFMADWGKRGKMEFVATPTSISAEQAHEVAMAAAEAAMRVPTHSPANIGLKFALAYLQAYEAVEGWTKPEPHTKHVSMPRYSFVPGDEFEIVDFVSQKLMKCRVGPNGCISWEIHSLPKDA